MRMMQPSATAKVYNHSKLSFKTIHQQDPGIVRKNLENYIEGLTEVSVTC